MAIQQEFEFLTPSQIALLPDKGHLAIPYPVSWADTERDLSTWLGNEMKIEVFSTLYDLEEKVYLRKDVHFMQEWLYLKASDHFYYMSIKGSQDGEVHKYFNPNHSPYDAFINYLNVITDFSKKIDVHLQLNPA